MSSSPLPASINFGYHLVLYLDLPGQRRELEKIRRVPVTAEEKAATVDAIAKSALRVKAIRDDLTLTATRLMQIDPAMLRMLPDNLRGAFLRFRSVKFKHVGFSDTFVVAVSLMPGPDPEGIARAATSVWALLAGAASVAMVAMRRQIPLRGGMTVGTAVDLFENEAYGAGLMEAYRLESTVAEYNRIVIGTELLEYLDEVDQLAPDTIFNRHAISQARQCRDLICYAPDDGRPMVHMLAPYIMRMPTSSGGTWEELRAPCREWVEAEARRFGAEGDVKLALRYERLLRYFDVYAPI
jgi:hypothetical protein